MSGPDFFWQLRRQKVFLANDKRLGDDLIYGVKAIADEIHRTERQTRWLIDNQSIRVGRMGRIIFASRSDLRDQIATLLKAPLSQ